MRRMKIRATPNFGGGGAPKNPQPPRNDPASAIPTSTSANSIPAPAATTSVGTTLSSDSSATTTTPSSPTSTITIPATTTHVNTTLMSITPVTTTPVNTTSINTSSFNNTPAITTHTITSSVITKPANILSVNTTPINTKFVSSTFNTVQVTTTPVTSTPSNITSVTTTPIITKPEVHAKIPSTLRRQLPEEHEDIQVISCSSKENTSISSGCVLSTSSLEAPTRPTSSVRPGVEPAANFSVNKESCMTAQEKVEGKSAANVRRRKLRFMPAVGGSKKGNVVEKQPPSSSGSINTNVSASVTHNEVLLKSNLDPYTCRDNGDQNNDNNQIQNMKANETSHVSLPSEVECELIENFKAIQNTGTVKGQFIAKCEVQSSDSLINSELSSEHVSRDLDIIKGLCDVTNGAGAAEVTENANIESSKKSTDKNVETKSSTISCSRRPKHRAMPSLLSKRKVIKKEVILQDTGHTSQAQPFIGKSGVQEGSHKSNIQRSEPCQIDTAVKLDPRTTKPVSCVVSDQNPDNSLAPTKVPLEPEIINKSFNRQRKEPKDIADVTILDVDDSEDFQMASRIKSKSSKKKERSRIGSEVEVEKGNENDKSKVKPWRTKVDNDNISSDDSSGDKENSVRVPTHHHIKKDIEVKQNKSQSLQKRKVKPSYKASPKKPLSKLRRKIKAETKTDGKISDDDCDNNIEKQSFKERKEKYRKKLSREGMEPSKMIMFDLIYWNPPNNPMPGTTESPKKRSHLSSKCETESITSDIIEEQKLDDLGLDAKDPAPGCSPLTHEEVQPCEDSSQSSKDSESAKKEEEELPENEISPRVKIGPNGQIIVDEQSIKIQTTAAKNRDEILSKAEVVEENNDTSQYGKWSKRRKRSSEWTIKETGKFYKALSTVGTDFSMMEALITWRSRAELKTKFKKEERANRELVDRALKDSTQFDMSLFDDESDYDPEEDRKATRLAERAEAKERRLALKQQDKALELKKKRLEKRIKRTRIMKRKKLLRRASKERSVKNSLVDHEGAAPTKPRTKYKRARIKKHKPERRDSIVISEVTVTMEYGRPTVTPIEPADGQSVKQMVEVMVEHTVEENHDSPVKDPLRDNATPSPLPFEPDDVCGMEGTEEEIQLNVDCVSSTLSEEYLQESPPEDHTKVGMEEPAAEYDLGHPELPEDLIIEGTAVEAFSSSEASNSNALDASPDAKYFQRIMDDVVTEEEDEAETEALESSQWSDAIEIISEDGAQLMWQIPVSAIQTQDDGQQVIVVPTSSGRYSVPVPNFPPGTSNIVVMATPAPDCSEEHIFHVYVMSPVDGPDQ